MRKRVTGALRCVGFRGSCLLAFAFLDIVYAASMVTSPADVLETNQTYQWFDGPIPLRAWAFIWAVVGVNCAVHAFTHDDRFGFVGAIGIKVIWSIGTVAGFFLSDVTLGGVGLWVSLMFLVWRIAGWAEPVSVGEDHGL